MPYINPEVVERVKQIDLLSYLQQHEPGNLVRINGSNYCTKEHDSLKISNGKWFWFSRGIGGYNALDYLTKVEEMPFIQAVQVLCGETFERQYEYDHHEENAPRILQIPALSEDTSRVRQYLMKRGIDPEIIDYGIQNALIFETAQYHNALFVGYDPGGIARYAAARSTFTNYKGDVTGSDKRFSFSFSGSDYPPELHLFEAAIDLLSYASILKLEGKDWQKDAMLSLAGVSAVQNKKRLPMSLEQYLKDHPEVKKIHLHLDNDAVGRGATAAIMNSLVGKYALYDEPPASGKDVNDDLIARKKAQDQELTKEKLREETTR